MNRQRTTVDLADLIEDKFLRFGVQRDIPLDDVAIEYRAQTGTRLRPAMDYVKKHLTAALDELKDGRGWVCVKVLQFHWRLLAEGRDAASPSGNVSDDERRRCLAGLGGRLETYGLHFVVGVEDDDLLFVEACHHGLASGKGRINASLRRIEIAANQGQISPDAIGSIAERAGIRTFQPAKRLKQAALAIAARASTES